MGLKYTRPNLKVEKNKLSYIGTVYPEKSNTTDNKSSRDRLAIQIIIQYLHICNLIIAGRTSKSFSHFPQITRVQDIP